MTTLKKGCSKLFSMLFLVLLGIICIETMFGCDEQSSRQRPIPQGDIAHDIFPNDPDFLAAQNEAQASWNQFISYLDWDNCAFCTCMAKRAFVEGGNVEHMWVGQLQLRDDTLWGILVNKPQGVHNIAIGDSSFVTHSSLEDWTCLSGNGIELGNFFEERRNK